MDDFGHRTRSETDISIIRILFAVAYSRILQIPNEIAKIWTFYLRSQGHVHICSPRFIFFFVSFFGTRNKNLSGDHCVTDKFGRQGDFHFSSADNRT